VCVTTPSLFGDPPVLGTVLADELSCCSPKLSGKAKERPDGLVCALALIKRTNQAVFDDRSQRRGCRHRPIGRSVPPSSRLDRSAARSLLASVGGTAWFQRGGSAEGAGSSPDSLLEEKGFEPPVPLTNESVPTVIDGIRPRKLGSHWTLRWRELDSNLRFRARAVSVLPLRDQMLASSSSSGEPGESPFSRPGHFREAADNYDCAGRGQPAPHTPSPGRRMAISRRGS
jgi:hypothetical protein